MSLPSEQPWGFRQLFPRSATDEALGMYVGSRSAEIAAVLDQIESRHGHAGAYLADPAAGTDSPVAVDARYVTPGEIRVEAASERDDVDAVEHIRQNRLRRWQKPADPTR